ncbi:MAG: response regulator [Acidobacteriota bacterium]|nr:response regulator [Acidobacteriota bacterium]
MIPEPILLVDDEGTVRSTLREALVKNGYTVEEADSGEAALAMVAKKHYPVVLTDLKMPGISGLELLGSIREKDPSSLCVVITGFATMEAAIDALKKGAYDFIKKPFQTLELQVVLDRALEHARLLKKVENYQADLESRVMTRTWELHAFHEEVLRLNALLLAAQNEVELEPLVKPFLDHLRTRFNPDGWALLVPDANADSWSYLVKTGEQAWPDVSAWGDLAAIQEAKECTVAIGYSDGFMVPLRHADTPLAMLVLGFDGRSSFYPSDRSFLLWKRQMESALLGLHRAMALARRMADPA